ncbi:MAG: hypothetical protein HN576_01660 [Bacteriovoracaceae bacterium]|nr:hypothetical protein [Bacteriovoracaceae bacterium]
MNLKKSLSLGFLTLLLLPQTLLAQAGADILLNNVAPPTTEQVNSRNNAPTKIVHEGLQLNDPMAIQLFTDWRNAGKLSYEVNSWFLKLLQGKYEHSAHLLSVIRNQVPARLKTQFLATEVYLYKKLGLNQKFFDSFVEFIQDKKSINSRIGLTLWTFADQHAEEFFKKEHIAINSSQIKIISNHTNQNTPFFTHVKSVVLLRKGEKALQTMINLKPGHPLKIPLAKTVVLDLARQNRLGEAGAILKKYVEPEIKRINDPYILGEYYINLARLLYQAGALDAAAVFYTKVPNKHPLFVQARAELMWTYLRTNKMAKLRGQIKSLESLLFADYFIPEIYVVRSISNLKLCQYNNVEKDFNHFIASSKIWAKKIHSNLKTNDPVWKEHRDFYMTKADNRIVSLELEIKELKRLSERSIKAALPAVGIQPHWKKALKDLAYTLTEARKRRVTEYKRLWKNRETILAEAIKKMKFVKIEALTQIQDIVFKKKELGKGIKATNVLSSKETNDKLIFPYDGVFWPDEILNLRSEAKSFCLKKASL